MKKKFFNAGLKILKENKLCNKKIIVSVSGGLDSIVMLDLLKELSRVCQLQIYVLHVHHGSSTKRNIINYRNKTKQFVQKLSQSYNLEFICPPPAKQILKNEEELRKFRHEQLQQVRTQKKVDLIALAHNKDDLLETQLINLIRGCGPQGLISMRPYEAPLLRPLLEWSRQNIQHYAQKNQLTWKEDPSNKDNQALRNWIRNKWLPQLEHKRTGASQSLSRSLQSLCQTSPSLFFQKTLSNKGINRRLFMELPIHEQKRILAIYMRNLNLSNYAQSHIEEILKLAERKKKSFSAKILKKTWIFNPEYIYTK